MLQREEESQSALKALYIMVKKERSVNVQNISSVQLRGFPLARSGISIRLLLVFYFPVPLKV